MASARPDSGPHASSVDAAHPAWLTPAAACTMLVFSMLLWAGGVVVARAVHELVPPVGFSFWRWFVASVLLTPVACLQARKHLAHVRERLPFLLLLGVFIAGGSTFLVWSVQFTTATNASLVSATQPIVTALMAWLLLGERLRAMQIAGVLAAAFGILVMVARMDAAVILALRFNPGDVLVLVAVVCYALYSIKLHGWLRLPPLITMYATCVAATLVVLPAYVAESLLVQTVSFSVELAGAVLFMALVPTVVATTMWNMSVGRIGASRASVFVNLVPIFGTVLAVVLLGEELFPYHVVGGALVCAGITLVVREKPAESRAG